jgi:hypothetical protein
MSSIIKSFRLFKRGMFGRASEERTNTDELVIMPLIDVGYNNKIQSLRMTLTLGPLFLIHRSSLALSLVDRKNGRIIITGKP